MTDIRDELLAALKPLQTPRPGLDVYSTVTGERMEHDRHDASYWWHNVRDTVLFADALKSAISDGHRIFLEVGPHPVLAASIRDVVGDVGAKAVGIASLTKGAPELATMHTALRSRTPLAPRSTGRHSLVLAPTLRCRSIRGSRPASGRRAIAPLEAAWRMNDTR